jgi:hypothetical protein
MFAYTTSVCVDPQDEDAWCFFVWKGEEQIAYQGDFDTERSAKRAAEDFLEMLKGIRPH